MVAITSEYGYWPYVIAALVFTLFPLIVLSIGLGCIARGAVFGKFVVTPFHMKIVGGIVAFVGTCFSTALAFAAGFWVMPTAASGFICFVVWAVLSPIAVMLFSEQVRFLIDPSTRSFRTAGTSPSHLHFTRSDQHFAVEMSRTPSSTQSPDILSTEASATLLFTPERSTAVSGAYPPTAAAFPEKAHPIEVVKPSDAPHQPRNRLENFWFCLRDDMMERKYVHAGVFLAALVGSALLILFIHNSCVCNKPQIMTTWISRKSETTYCAPDSVCFTYFMVGDNCSSLVAVAHFVQGSSGFTPTLAHAQVCMAPPGSSSAVCQPYAGILRPMDDIAEDMRYIAQVPLTNLQCNTTYYVNVIFDGPGGTSQQGPSKCVTTIPSAPRAPPGSNAADAFCFIGGGDYVVNDAGLPLLKRAMMQCPAAAFAFIGGDLGYDNNMRTCYKRTDRMLWEWTTALVRGDNQCSVPILTSIGNHDGGGYQWAGASTLATASGRADNNAFYLKYYPSRSLDTSLTGNQPAAARDWTQTTHVHDVGGVFGMIILDTGHILAVDSQQQQFLQQSFDYFRRKAMPVTLLYHVPAHPSVRAAEGGNSQTVLDNFVPLFDANDDLITLIFENHDHSYKRTKRLTNTNVATTNASSVPELRLPGRGVIYSGDGALGAHTSSDQGNLEEMGLTKNNNYVMVIRVMTNGSFAAEAWALDSAVTPMDAFLAV